MNGWVLLGLFLVLYAVAVFAIAIKKPEKIWDMAKIRFFRKHMGEKGTVIFFIFFGLVALAGGIALIIAFYGP